MTAHQFTAGRSASGSPRANGGGVSLLKPPTTHRTAQRAVAHNTRSEGAARSAFCAHSARLGPCGVAVGSSDSRCAGGQAKAGYRQTSQSIPRGAGYRRTSLTYPGAAASGAFLRVTA